MKNIPRIFIDQKLVSGQTVPLTVDQHHYLTHVMRTDKFLAFNDGCEYNAIIYEKSARILDKTNHTDPSGSWTFFFAPIKKIDELISGVTQMGAAALQPVITEHTMARNINWDRVRKIIIENAEQSGRNSIPKLLPPIPFSDLDKKNLIYGDERQFPFEGIGVARSAGVVVPSRDSPTASRFFIGPEGGFSDSEFAMLDNGGAIGISLGQTILRSEVAALALAATILCHPVARPTG